MPDPRELRRFRTMTITDVDETRYRLVGTTLEKKEALLDDPDKYEICLLCAMEPGNVREMTDQVRSLGTQDKVTIHQAMTEYMCADEHAKEAAPGLLLVGLFSLGAYRQSSHPWNYPAVLSRKIDRIG